MTETFLLDEFISNDKRVKYAVAFFYFSIFTDLFSVCAGINLYQLLSAANSGAEISMPSAEMADSLYSSAAILQLIAVILTGIFFLLWFHRAYKNLRPLGAINSNYKKLVGSFYSFLLCG